MSTLTSTGFYTTNSAVASLSTGTSTGFSTANSAIASVSTSFDTLINNLSSGTFSNKYFHANSTEADSSATGTNAIEIGPKALASGSGATVMGYNATASGDNPMALGTNANASAAGSIAIGYNSVANGATLNNAAYNPDGAAAGQERRITNVAAGSAPTDSVNVSQLQGVNNNIVNVGRKAYGGVASAMAMESAPYIAGTWTYAVGMGYYQSETAMAVSVRRTSDNNRWSLTGGVSGTAHGGVGARVAVTGILGRTN